MEHYRLQTIEECRITERDYCDDLENAIEVLN